MGVRIEKGKKGGCGKLLGVILLGLVGTFAFLLLIPKPQNDDGVSNQNVIVLPSQTSSNLVASDTPIPLPTNTPDLLTALDNVEPEREIIQAEMFELAQRMQIVFVMGQDLAGAEAYMLNVICAIRGYLPAGYGFRFAGDRGDGIELITAVVDAPAVQSLVCPATVSFESIASDYNVSEGLR